MRQLDMPASQQVVDAMMKEASKSGSGKVSRGVRKRSEKADS